MAEFEPARPVHVVLTTRNFTEYGSLHFGIDLDRQIYKQIEANYSLVDQYGELPHRNMQTLAVMLYRRRAPEDDVRREDQ